MEADGHAVLKADAPDRLFKAGQDLLGVVLTLVEADGVLLLKVELVVCAVACGDLFDVRYGIKIEITHSIHP